MSTRANIIIRDTSTTLYFYRHSDGYPECTGADLVDFMKGYSTGWRMDAMQSAGWLIIRGYEEHGVKELRDKYMQWKVGAYEPTEKLHSDVEYIYIIDLDLGTIPKLSCRTPNRKFWHNPVIENTEVFRLNKSGTEVDEECEHGDTDDYCCLDCGKDLTEDRMAMAYDMAKARRQDA